MRVEENHLPILLGTNWKIKAIGFVFFVLLYSCQSDTKKSASDSKVQTFEYASTRYLIEPEELQEKLALGSEFKLIDSRILAEYSTGHIENAVNIWRNHLADTSYAYGGMMPTKLQLEQLLGSLGISPSDTLIIYDNNAEVDAARLWWILKFYGHENMKLLNGGLRSWLLIDSALTNQVSDEVAVHYQFENPVDSTIYASFETVKNVVAGSNVKLLDVRGLDEYSGQKLKNGAAWPGHIPNTINLNWAEAVDYNGDHKFLSAAELKLKYEALGITGDKPIISYCHSGVRSSHTLFVLTELLGYKNVRNYDGSWTEWSHLNPIED